LTLVCFIGFFLRDIMMAQRFGLGPALDSFFIALLIPMFIVTVFCMPLGAVFVPVYLNIKEQSKPPAARALLSVTSFWTTIALMIICTLLYLAGSTLLSLLHLKNLPVNMEQLIRLSNLALPLLLFSGVVILGNSVLNANGRAVLSSSAQLVVPISAILALLFFGNRFGIEAVMLGMVIGQLINLIVVQYYIGHYDASLVPQPELHHQIKFSPLLQQYFPLMASAFFVASATPVATLLAISLPVGSVSAFNLGSKVVLFVTGLVSTTVTAIMLPYFSILISKKNLISARRELSFFLLLATFVSVPISAGLYIWSEPIVRIIFERGSFDIGAVALVARVMQYAVIQLPFFVCNMLLLKFLIATKHVFALSVVTVLGLLLNVGAGVLLMPHMGVVGIALGTSVSVIFTTVLLILVLVRYKHISKFDLIILFLNGLMFITLLVSLHFKSFSSAFIIIFTYAILLIGYISTLRDNQFSTIK
jgi:putative peptidoglycan lipid II flippase